MLLNILKALKRHSSLFMMGAGSASIFFTNLGLKGYLNDIDYGSYSLLITYFTLLNSFGLLGSEQVLLRLSELQKESVLIDKKIFYQILILLIVIPFISSFAFIYGAVSLNFYFLTIASFFILISMLTYNLLRLIKHFFYAQLVNNIWKITLLSTTLYLLFFTSNVSTEIILKYISTIYIICTIGYLFLFVKLLKNKLHISSCQSEGNQQIKKWSFNFFIALFSLSFLSTFDKFAINYFIGIKYVGDYFFLTTLFLFPFSLVQSYIGFKSLVIYKYQPEKSKSLLNSNVILSLSIGFLGSIALITVAYFTNLIGLISVDLASNKVIIGLLLFTGIIKLVYSNYSAAFGAKTSLKAIQNANLIFIIALSLIFVLCIIWNLTIPFIASLVFCSWGIRTLIWRHFVKKLI